ncbi:MULTISPECIES: ACT domain-containing protein [unclassified Streptomyces]|uniref:ACT domain-containing protein n=1 Tax=unclassified Streptomyces TaxID=2593676 RepID=UPI001CD10DC2|nr:ACT domain-containing protein [Streptomyces sp. PSKA30]MBZ9643201.1 ACT domain-containing protein [Streptomyces sp. PSKA30]
MQPTATPPDGHAEVNIVAASPEVARRVAEVLRHCFAATEQRSYPADTEGGTRLQLTVDTTRPAEPARSWLETSRSAEDARRRK